MLTIDAGNSRVKWALFDAADKLVQRGVFTHDELLSGAMRPEAWTDCYRAVIANVAGAQFAERIRTLLGADMDQRWIRAAASGFGITNAYAVPEQLGCDRWAALVGARQYATRSCVVVNAGTALTVDALLLDALSGEYLFAGGVILPGYRLQQQALLNGVHGIRQLPASAVSGAVRKIPTDTGTAVQSGVLLAMAGAIEKVAAMVSVASGGLAVRCVLSGGDAELLLQELRDSAAVSDIVAVEDLVLRGLLQMGRALS